MPVLSNPKHEAFAQGLAKGKSQAEAYADAGYKGDRTAASRLSTNVNVLSRVAELQEKAAEKTLVTVESLTEQLDRAYGCAMANDQAAAAVSATMAKAKLHGLDIDRKLIDIHHHYHDMSDEELDQELAQALKDESAAATAH